MTSNGKNEKASNGKKAMSSKRGKALNAVAKITGVPDGVSDIMADYLAIDYRSDKSVQCRDFSECHQNLRFREVDRGDNICRKCWQEFIKPRPFNLSDYDSDGDTDEGRVAAQYD